MGSMAAQIEGVAKAAVSNLPALYLRQKLQLNAHLSVSRDNRQINLEGDNALAK